VRVALTEFCKAGQPGAQDPGDYCCCVSMCVRLAVTENKSFFYQDKLRRECPLGSIVSAHVLLKGKVSGRKIQQSKPKPDGLVLVLQAREHYSFPVSFLFLVRPPD